MIFSLVWPELNVFRIQPLAYLAFELDQIIQPLTSVELFGLLSDSGFKVVSLPTTCTSTIILMIFSSVP
jgi:hypothetical protein